MKRLTMILMIMFVQSVCGLALPYVAAGEVDRESPDYAELIWADQQNSGLIVNDQPVGVVVDGNGNVVVSGTAGLSPMSGFFFTLKYTADGELLWRSLDGFVTACDFVVDSSGDIYVTGQYLGFDGAWYLYSIGTIKISADGNTLWEDSENYAGGRGNAAALDADDNLYVAGNYTPINKIPPTYAIRRYGIGGSWVWNKRMTAATAYDVAVDAEGNIFATGGGDNVYTSKHSPEGQLRWMKSYADPAGLTDIGKKIVVDQAGRAYVVAHSQKTTENNDLLVIAYNNIGIHRWIYRYSGAGQANETAADIAVDAFGNVIVAGVETNEAGDLDGVVLKLDADGNLLWEWHLTDSKGGTDTIRVMTLDSIGNIYITGETPGTSGLSDIYLAKISRDGQLRWEETFNGDDNLDDVGLGISLDDTSNVYVTGTTENIVTGTDYITLRYRQVCSGCFIDDLCYADGEVNPNNVCQVCDLGAVDDQWTADDGVACDDGLFCNGADTCLSGVCQQHEGDPCEIGTTCDEELDECIAGDDDDDDDSSDDDSAAGDDDDNDAVDDDDDDNDDDNDDGCGC